MRTIHQFNPAGRRDGPVQPAAPPTRNPRVSSHPTSDNKPGSARPHGGGGGTRNMAQSSVVPVSVPMSGRAMQPGASHTGTPGKGLA